MDNGTVQAIVLATFDATALAGPAARLGVITHHGSAAALAAPLASQPVVQLIDQYVNFIKQGDAEISADVTAGGRLLPRVRLQEDVIVND